MKIFRGESLVDARLIEDIKMKKERESRILEIKPCLQAHSYPTKMIGGDPYLIAKESLLKIVVQHISEVYKEIKFNDTKYFLSFSEKIEVALHFSTAGENLSKEAVGSDHTISSNKSTDLINNNYTEFLIIEIDISDKIPVKNSDGIEYSGVYLMSYPDKMNLLLINSLAFLKANKDRSKDLDGYMTAINDAEIECEWLVLPAVYQTHLNSLTALISIDDNIVKVYPYLSPDFYSSNLSRR